MFKLLLSVAYWSAFKKRQIVWNTFNPFLACYPENKSRRIVMQSGLCVNECLRSKFLSSLEKWRLISNWNLPWGLHGGKPQKIFQIQLCVCSGLIFFWENKEELKEFLSSNFPFWSFLVLKCPLSSKASNPNIHCSFIISLDD